MTREKLTMGVSHRAKPVPPLTLRHFTSIWIWGGLTCVGSTENSVDSVELQKFDQKDQIWT